MNNHGLNESTSLMHLLEQFENKNDLDENCHIDIKLSKYCNVNYFIDGLARFERGLCAELKYANHKQ